MVKRIIHKIRQRRISKKLEFEDPTVPRITNDNVAEHREEVLSGARKYIYPLQHSKHQIVIITTSVVIVAVMTFLISLVVLLYRQQTTSSFVYEVTKVVPFPVARTGNTFIAYENYLFKLRQYIHYYETQQKLSFDSEAGRDQLNSYKKRALDEVIDLAYLKMIAKDIGVSVSESEIDEKIREKKDLNQLGSTDEIFESVLKDYLDWTVSDLRRSLHEELLKQKVVVALDPDTERRAQQAFKELEEGADFAKVAKKYSDDPATKNKGGEFGVVDANSRNTAVSQQTVDKLLGLKTGEYSSVIVVRYNTGYALEIVKNIEKKKNQVKGAHIIFKLNDVSGILNDMKEKQPYRLYISLPQ